MAMTRQSSGSMPSDGFELDAAHLRLAHVQRGMPNIRYGAPIAEYRLLRVKASLHSDRSEQLCLLAAPGSAW